jgi:V-type H+-transporting ATPase subunit a
VPTYLEANPALISMVTFPWLFGMMFGDMGHGSILLAFALVLVFGNSRLKDTVLAPVLQMRYILMFLGICATYCGFIYNEFFAMQTNIFASCYNYEKREQFNPEVAADDGSG